MSYSHPAFFQPLGSYFSTTRDVSLESAEASPERYEAPTQPFQTSQPRPGPWCRAQNVAASSEAPEVSQVSQAAQVAEAPQVSQGSSWRRGAAAKKASQSFQSLEELLPSKFAAWIFQTARHGNRSNRFAGVFLFVFLIVTLNI